MRDGDARLPTPPGEPPAELTKDHRAFGGLSERDWERRFQNGSGDAVGPGNGEGGANDSGAG